MKHAIRAAVTAALLLGAMPSGAQVEEFIGNKPAQLRPFFKALYMEGERNAVLNFNHLGLAAMELGHWMIAKKAFDQAIMRIDAIYASDENAKKAKSIWNEEKVKDWKGEPYERVMTYYYRGLLYIKDGEFDNAAAAFRAADYQDTQAEAEEYRGDFGLMPFMAAWAQSCRGNSATAKDLYSSAIAKDKSVAPLTPDMKFLVLVDSGLAPVKYGDGKYKEVLKIRAPQAGREKFVKVVTPSAEAFSVTDTWAVGDVQMQAETRGGRPIDGILNGKAQWKAGTETAGQVATTVGLAAMQAGFASNNRDFGNAGAIVGLLGMFANMAAAAMTPAADVRRWGSLPNLIHAAGVNVITSPLVAAKTVEPPAVTDKSVDATGNEKLGATTDTPSEKRADASPTEAGSAEENLAAKPAMDAKSEEAKPAEAKPADDKAVEAKAVAAKPAELKIKIEFETAAGKQEREPMLMTQGGTCGIAWGRTRSALMPGDGGVALVSASPKVDDDGREKQNGAFRSQLFQTF